jgi:hypothetical protein
MNNMQYKLKHPINVYVNEKEDPFDVYELLFHEPKGKHLFANDISLDGLIEDYNSYITIEKNINELQTDFRISKLDGTFNEVEKLEKIFSGICNKFANSSSSKAIFYKKIDVAIRNIFFTKYDYVSLVEGFNQKGDRSAFLTQDDYGILTQTDLIGIRDLIIKKNFTQE